MSNLTDDDLRRVCELFDRDHDRLRSELMDLLPEQVPQPAVGRLRRGWQWIGETKMRRRTFGATAVAASVLLVVLGFWPSENGSGRAYAMSDVPELLGSARTVHMKGWMYMPSSGRPSKGQTRVDYEVWLDAANGRLRQTYPGVGAGGGMIRGRKIGSGRGSSWSGSPGDIELILCEKVSDGQYVMMLNHTDKSVEYSKLNPFHRALQSRQNVDALHRRLFGRIDKLDGFRKEGQQRINGKAYDVWKGMLEGHRNRGGSSKYECWLAPDTGEIGRIHTWRKRGGKWARQMSLDTIERNAVPPPGVFATSPPAGYRLINTKDTAPTPRLNGGGGMSTNGLSFRCSIGFLLGDGSVILGWSSGDRKAPGSQLALFADLTVGGPVPRLPIEARGLTREYGGKKIRYSGHHLAYTHTDDEFHEWSIYVPDREPPAEGRIANYEVSARWNVEGGRVRNPTRPIVSPPIPVAADEFDVLVRGAMAELSDDGKAPEHVTHANVQELSKKLRD